PEALIRSTHSSVWASSASGSAYLTPAKLDGRWMARISIGGLLTDRAEVAALWARMRDEAGGISP
ncbi:MAG: aspartate aminotransferase family protein, partial [Opitutaceae bacterium]